MNVVVLDTGCANLFSVTAAVRRLGYEPVVSREDDIVLQADKLFLPGVGTARAAMDQLRERELIALIKACTQPVLGICLGIIDAPVTRMADVGLPLPHMGWNQVTAGRQSPIPRH